MKPETRALLVAARARIADPAHWCMGTEGMTADGAVVLPEHPLAARWCAVGAIRGLARPSAVRLEACDILSDLAQALYATEDITDVNDRLGHAAVLALYDAALAERA